MDTQLMELFGFDEEDLASNQSAMLSPKQEERVKARAGSQSRVLIIVGLAALAGVVFRLRRAFASIDLLGGVVGWVGVGIFALLVLWALIRLFRRPDNAVRKAEGALNLVKSITKSGSLRRGAPTRQDVVKYEMVVGGVWFGISGSTFTALLENEGDRFAVYYTNATKMLLSVEYLGPTEAAVPEN